MADTRGGTAVLVALALPVLLGFGALAIDGARLSAVENRLQVAADAAAVAGAEALKSADDPETAACQSAFDFAAANLRTQDTTGSDPAFVSVELLSPSGDDTVECEFDFKSKTFVGTSGGCPDGCTAVKVTAKRTDSAKNPVRMVLGPILGRSFADRERHAVAELVTANCSTEWGIIAKTTVDFDKGADLDDGACVYGGDAVSFKKNADVGENASVGSQSTSDITFREPKDVEGELFSGRLTPSDAENIDGLIADIRAGRYPSGITRREKLNNGKFPSSATPNTIYWSEKNITVDKNADLQADRFMIVTPGKIQFKKDADINPDNFDCGDKNSIVIVSGDTIRFDKQADLEFVRIWAKSRIWFKKAVDLSSVELQTTENIVFKKEASIEACDVEDDTPSVGTTIRLVE